MNYIFYIVIIAAVIPGYWCGCKTIEELDQCAHEINFLSNRDIKAPTNDAEVVAMCDKAKVGLKCLADHARECAKGALKSVTIKVMNDMENHLHSRCDNPAERAEFLKHIACFQDSSKADPIRLCADKHMVMMEKVSNLPKPLRLGGSCCSSHALRECVINHVNNLCSGETGEYFDDMISDVAEENIELVCKEFATLDKCDAKYDPATWGELKGIMASEDTSMINKHQYKTIVPIIIKMLKEARRR